MLQVTRSSLDRAVIARYFAFLIISQLFIFSLIGVGFSKPVPRFNSSSLLTLAFDAEATARVAGIISQHESSSEVFKALESMS